MICAALFSRLFLSKKKHSRTRINDSLNCQRLNFIASSPTEQVPRSTRTKIRERDVCKLNHFFCVLCPFFYLIPLQPYRTTPLVLPGAKVSKMDALPTESYLRHHPNPAMRAPPLHDFSDTLMRQKVKRAPP